MSTRANFGLIVDGETKLTYCHSDGYPEGLGTDVLTWLRAAMDAPDVLLKRARALRIVSDDTHPNEEEIERYREWSNANVGTQKIDDWYCLLRQLQGEPHDIVMAGVAYWMPNQDDLEWAYVVDLDTATFNVYKLNIGAFDPHKIVAQWPLSALPEDEEFLEKSGTNDDD